jgi:hypothetical protein
MRRRDFFAMIGGAAMACSLPARAQERMRRIGALLPATADDPEFQARMMAFQQELALSGWFIGNNVRIDIRWVTPNPADVRKNAAELVALAPDVILAFGAVTVGAAAAGDPHRADRVPARRRSGRCRPRRQPGPAGRQRHWFPVVRIRHEREMAGVAHGADDAAPGVARSVYGTTAKGAAEHALRFHYNTIIEQTKRRR